GQGGGLLRLGVRLADLGRLTFLAHHAHEAQALAGQGPDQALSLAAVPDGAPSPVDAAAQRRFRDDAPVPDLSDQVVAADDALAVLDHISPQIEDLRLDGNPGIAAAQRAPFRVEGEIFEQIEQIASPRLRAAEPSVVIPTDRTVSFRCLSLESIMPLASALAVMPGTSRGTAIGTALTEKNQEMQRKRHAARRQAKAPGKRRLRRSGILASLRSVPRS